MDRSALAGSVVSTSSLLGGGGRGWIAPRPLGEARARGARTEARAPQTPPRDAPWLRGLGAGYDAPRAPPLFDELSGAWGARFFDGLASLDGPSIPHRGAARAAQDSLDGHLPKWGAARAAHASLDGARGEPPAPRAGGAERVEERVELDELADVMSLLASSHFEPWSRSLEDFR